MSQEKEEKKVMVVFGGSFNPPLNSHFSLAEQIVTEYSHVEHVIFVPVNSKYNKPGLLGNEPRYEMLKLVIDQNVNFLLSRIELDSDKPLYTIETLQKIQSIYQDHEIWFTIGSDNLKQLHTWEKAEELVQNFKILVLERGQDQLEQIVQESDFLRTYSDSFMKVKDNIRSNMSSTFVRAKIKRGKSILVKLKCFEDFKRDYAKEAPDE